MPLRRAKNPGAGSAGGSRKAGPAARERQLLARVKAAEQSLRKIPARDVDALVVFGRPGPRVITLRSESAYRMLVETMSEGAATVSTDGVVLYCNRRFAQLAGRPLSKLVGENLHSFIHAAERESLTEFLRSAKKRAAKGEFSLVDRTGRRTPVHLSLGLLRGYRGRALGAVVTDLTEQKKNQKAEMRRAESIHRLLLERELAAQEGERRRIARELHDEAGQLLTSLLVALRSMADSKSLSECKTLGKRMRQITAQAIDEVGRLARGLHPIALDDHGLSAAVSRYAAEYAQIHSLRVHLDEGPLDTAKFSPAVQIALYRILQETLTNVARHAQARNVHVDFQHSEKALTMSVTDDGHGFDISLANASGSSHLGLRSIRERTALLGGTVTFRSGSKGTQVLVQIPLGNGADPAVRGRKG